LIDGVSGGRGTLVKACIALASRTRPAGENAIAQANAAAAALARASASK
jgi:hypothetical protein